MQWPAAPERRLGATAIDLVVWILLIDAVAAPTDSATTTTPLAKVIIGTWIGLTILGYWVLPIVLGGGSTLGKRLLKIRVVRTDGTPVGFWRAALRVTTFLALLAIPLLGLINVLSCSWDKPLQQCRHDKFAETYVVRRPKRV